MYWIVHVSATVFFDRMEILHRVLQVNASRDVIAMFDKRRDNDECALTNSRQSGDTRRVSANSKNFTTNAMHAPTTTNTV